MQMGLVHIAGLYHRRFWLAAVEAAAAALRVVAAARLKPTFL
jgi:hypothetical protein